MEISLSGRRFLPALPFYKNQFDYKALEEAEAASALCSSVFWIILD